MYCISNIVCHTILCKSVRLCGIGRGRCRSNNIFVRILSAPGMLIQRLTTKEPDEDMVEVAIASVEAVYDWQQFLIDEFGFSKSDFVKEEDEAFCAEDENFFFDEIDEDISEDPTGEK